MNPNIYDQKIIEKKYLANYNWILEINQAKITAGDVEYLISPLTGERIPASKMDEHMRVGLLDPAWVEKRKQGIYINSTLELFLRIYPFYARLPPDFSVFVRIYFIY